MTSHPLLVIAAKECRDRIRNRWVLAVAVLFALFALAIACFGPAQQGLVGFQGIAPTIASLVSLVIYLLPLIALILGFDSVVGERERGSLDLLLSMPLTRGELLLGKYLGLAAALTLATVGGFGVAGTVLAPQLDANAAWHYAGFIVSALLLGYAFLSLALLISVVSRERTRASGAAIALWFALVLVFDLLLLGGMVLLGDTVGWLFGALLLANPADVFRMLNIFSSEQLQNYYGLATALPGALTHPVTLCAVMLTWIALPLATAGWLFARR